MGVYKRGNTWYIRYKFQGRLCRKAIGPNKRVGQAKLAKIKAEIAENRHLEVKRDKRITFADFIEKEYIPYIETRLRSWKVERYRLTQFNKVFGNLFLSNISSKILEQYLTGRLKGHSNATVNRDVARLKNIFKMAVQWGFISENPARYLKKFPENNMRMRFLTRQEFERVLVYLPDELKALFITAAYTGLRKSELLSLTWANIDWDSNLIYVLDSKNSQPRKVPMAPVVHDVLEKIKTINISHSKIFVWRDGRAIKDFRESLKNALAKAGISDFRFHDLRHTFASWLVMKGVDLRTVQELLGHKTVQMVYRYAHLCKDYLQEAVDKLGKIDVLEVAQKVAQGAKS